MADMYGNYYGSPYGGMVGVNPNQQYATYDYGYGQPMMMNPNGGYIQKSTLSKEEFDQLRNRPGSGLDLMNIPAEEGVASFCNHVAPDGREATHMLPDGRCECDICHKIWDPTIRTKEQIQESVDNVVSCMQNIKLANVLPVQTMRDYFPMIPLIEKLPQLYDYSMKQIDRQINGNSMYGAAQDASVYAQYRNIMYNTPYQAPMYGQPMYGQPMYGQPYVAPQAPVYGQPAQPGVSPMDINAGQAQAPVNYAAAPQPQAPVYAQPAQPFANPMYGQAPMYGGYQGQPMAPNPYGAPAPAVAPQPVYGAPQAQAPAKPQAPTTTPDGATVQNNGDGTASSSKKITLA